MNIRRHTIPVKLVAAICGMLLVSFLSGSLGFLGINRTSDLFERIRRENVTSMHAANELRIAMLEQRGLVANFILDTGNPIWLEDLNDKRTLFDENLSHAKATVFTEHEEQILTKLEAAYQRYDKVRSEVIQQHELGKSELATEAFVEEMPRLFDEAYQACDDLIVANMSYMNEATSRMNLAAKAWWYVALFCLSINCVLAAMILFLLANGIYRPLRKLAFEAQLGQATNHKQAQPNQSGDDFSIVRNSIVSLSNEVASAHQSLIQSRDDLQQAEKMASIGKLSAGIAHEIRSLLTTMKLWAFSLGQADVGSADVQETFDVMGIELKRLEQLVQFFLESARPPQLNQTECQLAAVVEQAVFLVQPRMDAKKLSLQQQLEPTLPAVLADTEQLKQVFVNLLTNACEASEPGGSLSIHGTWQPAGDPNAHLVVRFTNNGPPIPVATQSRIFEHYLTTKKNGVGLGLAIAATIVDRHGGDLRLESSDKQGTVFALFLPPYREAEDGKNFAG